MLYEVTVYATFSDDRGFTDKVVLGVIGALRYTPVRSGH